ncbi:DUF1707 and DUF2154 domain-containing protein [Streptomyces sp. ISL-1]|uniref:DUF1707 SHOCT-like domain-containing protein n=1 Tax=Streptomyces sp. ISL-1 TaxID=2817657 RepID=UPI001BE5D06C|nr:DUF1707 domain-containing protein [Streptomyces sp. ISL-1]MBT2389643.1 DUF1707 and DUF2154 domain-containing protein [Streptomyces sp. ISL-1]
MTSELPEMRASDAERERVAERLRDAVAEGRLDMEEFGQRLDDAYEARTHGELEPLVSDLPAAGTVSASPAVAAGSGGWAQRVGGPATSKWAFAFWGGFGRKGTWTVARRFTSFTMMGGGELDLREARFEDRVTVIRCIAIMGGVNIVVPPDLNVEVNGIGFMGGFAEQGEGNSDPAAPRVIVTGFALMGGVNVERKRTRAEKQRLRAEREEERRGRLEKGDRKELD